MDNIPYEAWFKYLHGLLKEFNIEDGIVAYRIRCSNAHCLARTQRFPALHQAEMEWNTRTATILRLEHRHRDWEYVIKHWL